MKDISMEVPVKYTIYNIRTYFACQPRHIQICPTCGYWISRINVNPSKGVADSLSDDQLFPVHDFSVVYVCEKCYWWGIRESGGYLELSTSFDYLIVCAEEEPRAFDITDHETSPWRKVLGRSNLYHDVLPLPDSLGRLFVGGTVKENVLREIEQAATHTIQKTPWEQLEFPFDTESRTAKAEEGL